MLILKFEDHIVDETLDNSFCLLSISTFDGKALARPILPRADESAGEALEEIVSERLKHGFKNRLLRCSGGKKERQLEVLE